MPEDQLDFEFRPPAESLRELWTPDDIYKNCNDDTIRAFGEDRRVERKRVEVKQRDFAAYLSMWANTQPSGGVIFVGVDNKGAVLGCKHCGDDHLNEFETALGMQEANLPDPIFTQRESGVFQVSVTLKNDVEHRKNFVRFEAMPAIDPLIYETLSDAERLLVNWCADGRKITVKDAQDILGDMASDWRAAKAILDSLTKKFVFERPPGKDRDRHRKWSLRKKRGRNIRTTRER